MKPNWKSCPPWATHWLELEGNRELWSSEAYALQDSLKFKWDENLPVLAVPDVEDSKKFFSLRVLQCIPRPQWETLVHYKESGEHRTLKTEGWWTHSAIKRELGVDNNFRFMLEYVKLN